MRIARITSLLFALLILLSACGTKNTADVSQPKYASTAFELMVNDESFIGGGYAEDIVADVQKSSEGAEVSIQVTGAAKLKALYFTLTYNPEQYTPTEAEPAEAMQLAAANEDLLTLAILNQPGTVHYGQVFAHWPKLDGFSGDGELVSISFSKQPYSASRVVSAPPTTGASQTILTKQGSSLEWYYFSQGDYDQNGEVNIADLTPLGVHYAKSSSPLLQFSLDTVESVVDGDSNGETNIADITPIGSNYGNDVTGGYNVYESLNISDYPATPDDFGDPPTIPALINVPFTSIMGDRNTDRMRFQSHVLTSQVNAYYWVRPTDGTSDGTPSNLTGGDTTTAVQFSVSAPPASGNGTQRDPYVIGGSSVVDFELYDPVAQAAIAITDPNVALSLDDNSAGTINTSGQFVGDAAFSGRVCVFALYQSIPTNPQKICFFVTAPPPANNPPIAIAHATPTAGYSPLQVLFDATSSYDVDSGDVIQTIEWDFGDGAGFQVLSEMETYQYAAAGTYPAQLRATDTNSATATDSLLITVSDYSEYGPTAALVATPSSGDLPLAVTFDASGSTPGTNAIDTYQYDFLGNGAFVLGADTAAYTFNQAGAYRVVVKVTDTAGYIGSAWADVIVTDPAGGPVYPLAVLGVAPDKGHSPLAVNFDFTGSTTGTNISYTLDPNDGSTAYTTSAMTQAHTYNASTETTFLAALIATDTSTSLSSWPAVAPVTVYPAGALLAVLTATPSSGQTPLDVAFDATGSSGGTTPYTYDFDFENDGTWDVTGDTTGTTNHTYSANGTYKARVRVTDSASNTDEDTVLINVGGSTGPSPVASLVATPDNGAAPLLVTLDATGTTGGTTPYTFDFDYEDDGTWDVTGNTTGTTPYTYNTPDTYTARVRVTDSSSPALTDEATATITVTTPGPLAAALIATPSCGGDPLAVTLDATGTTGGYPPYTYDFDYEDDGTWDVTGNTSGSAPNTYTPTGTYTARVRVTDSDTPTAQTDEDTATIEVTDPLAPSLVATPNCGMAPLMLNFDATGTTGGKAPLTYDFDVDDDGTYEYTGNTSGMQGHTYGTAGSYTVRVRVSDSCGTPQTTSTTATVDATNPLNVVLTATPNSGLVPPDLNVVLDATGTTGGMPPYTYDFDYDGDGLWDVIGDTTGSAATAYNHPGSFTAYVRVTDSCAASPQVQQGTAVINTRRGPGAVPPNGWHVFTVASITGNNWSYTGLTLIDDGMGARHPAISFFDANAMAPGLFYIRALDTLGTTWPPAPTPVIPVVGVHSSLKEVAGNPAIAYFDDLLSNLEYIRAGDLVGNDWVSPAITVATPDANNCGSWNSLDFIQDPISSQWWPAISYIGALEMPMYEIAYHGGEVRYVRAQDPLGVGWNVPQVVDQSLNPEIQFACTSLEYVDPGNDSPAVSYVQMGIDPLNNMLKYSIAVDPLGDTWSRLGFPTMVEPSIPGFQTSLELFGGVPWISWSFGAANTLHILESQDSVGVAWNPAHVPDPPPSITIGDWSSLEVTNNLVACSYVDYGMGPLLFVDMSASSPVTWNPAPEVVDPAGTAWGTYLIEINGWPAISYYITTIEGTEVRYAIYY